MAQASPIRLHVWGEFACLTRPEMKVERVSYDVLTPSAARGILESIYWKPAVRWVVERIRVLNEIRFTNLRRNEVASKASAQNARKAMNGDESSLGLYIEEDRQQRAAMILRDVAYVIEARFELLDDSEPVAKHYNMFKRRAESGQCWQQPYLGTREFPCSFAWLDGASPAPHISLQGVVDLGYVLHDLVYEAAVEKQHGFRDGRGRPLSATARFFRARMVDGVIEIPPLGSGESA